MPPAAPVRNTTRPCWGEDAIAALTRNSGPEHIVRGYRLSSMLGLYHCRGDCMSGLRIYGIARTRAFRALWAAEELGLSFEHLPIEIGPAGARSPEFAKLNPNGRLPFIVDSDFVLFESLAITLYLAKKYSPGRLSRLARRRGAGLAMELLGDFRGRPRRQYLVAARGAPAAGGAQRGFARRSAESG